jgi:hypothetical protein
MMFKRVSGIVILILGSLSSFIYSQETAFYKCTVDGRLAYSDKPCSSDKNNAPQSLNNPLTGSDVEKRKADEKRAGEIEKENQAELSNKLANMRIEIALKFVKIGMSKQEFMALFKDLKIQSLKINKTTTATVVKEQLVLAPYRYDKNERHYYYFRNNILTTIQD